MFILRRRDRWEGLYETVGIYSTKEIAFKIEERMKKIFTYRNCNFDCDEFNLDEVPYTIRNNEKYMHDIYHSKPYDELSSEDASELVQILNGLGLLDFYRGEGKLEYYKKAVEEALVRFRYYYDLGTYTLEHELHKKEKL